jgi:hypothetical protein
MPENKRYCFETCTKDEALAESIGELKRYWVRSPQGAIDMYFERSEWPKNVEFVRPATIPASQRRRIVYEECTREESLHLLFEGGPKSVRVFTGDNVQEWLDSDANESDVKQYDWFFVRPATDAVRPTWTEVETSTEVSR